MRGWWRSERVRPFDVAQALGRDLGGGVAVVSGRWLGRSGAILHDVLVKRGGFTEEEAERIRATARRPRFLATYLGRPTCALAAVPFVPLPAGAAVHPAVHAAALTAWRA